MGGVAIVTISFILGHVWVYSWLLHMMYWNYTLQVAQPLPCQTIILFIVYPVFAHTYEVLSKSCIKGHKL